MFNLTAIGQKLFKNYFLTFVVSFALIYTGSLAFLVAFAEVSLSRVIYFSITFVMSALLISVWASLRVIKPIIKITEKAQRLSSRRLSREMATSHEDIFSETGEGLSDLEAALEKIQRKYRDNEERRLTERLENQVMLSQVQEAIVMVDAQGRFRFSNKKFSELFSTERSVLKNQLLEQVFRQPEILEPFKTVLKTQEQFRSIVKIYSKYYSLSVSPLIDKNLNTVYAVLGVFYDISEIKKAEQIRIDFVSNASHELKTPLTSIKGYVETIKGDLKEKRYDELDRFLGVVSKNVDHLIELVQDLLSLSKLDSQMALAKKPVDVQPVTQSVVEDFLPAAQAKNQKIFLRFQIDQFMADERKIEQILRNLIANALKYTQEGGQIEVTWGEHGDRILLSVKDNGPGIAHEHHERVFERFYRIDQGRSRDQGGTGLGLAIVKHIALIHGGVVRLVSKVGQGSEFICEFAKK